MSDTGPLVRMMDFFPAYEAYGLREVAVTENPIDLLRWISSTSHRSFDSLAEENREAFAATASKYFMDMEFRAASHKAQDLLESNPHHHSANLSEVELSMVAPLGRLLDAVLEMETDAEVMATIADAVHFGTAATVMLHEIGS